MARRLVRERRAHADLVSHVDYYVDRRLYAVADAFISAFEHFCDLVVQHPEMAPLFLQAESEELLELHLRIWPLGHHFPHLVFYYLSDEEIRIYAVLHGHVDLIKVL